MSKVESIIKDKSLTFEQMVVALAREAENNISVLNISEKTEELRKSGVICDLFEGNAPYRPRYIIPNYEKFMAEGSKFLGLKKPKDIWEAVNNLLIFYKHVPSITTMPVYIGNIDTLLDPFIKSEREARRAIEFFLLHIDRTITDSFCHGNLGPRATRAGRIILEIERELENAIPNLTLKYNEDTEKEFALEAIRTSLKTAKPSFANDEMFKKDFNGDYAIASCYNGLPIGGGAYTLVRMNLKKLAESAQGKDDFFHNKLPEAMEAMGSYINERIRYLVEETAFFHNNFLVKEGFIEKEKFTAMFGIVGLAEAVDYIMEKEGKVGSFGHDVEFDDLGEEIIKELHNFVLNYKSPHCKITEERLLMHAQVGISDDNGVSPGCRIQIGNEPEIWKHLRQAGRFHKYFPSGIGDIFPFEENAINNPEYILNIIEGAFKVGIRYFSLYSSTADVIRITGYLVKKSEMEKLKKGEAVMQDTVALGLGATQNCNILNRKIR